MRLFILSLNVIVSLLNNFINNISILKFWMIEPTLDSLSHWPLIYGYVIKFIGVE